ncbi:unnamed protein product [Dovyalis caffra]|uniref:Histone deacetylase interacting domain-containing protein n=1 Tax=Dovyalis caffra TaxID=77055 RepID=A0AAV1R6T4_9ROSI|nr:unnamed protein product [Dovyalis caffra]
MKRIRDDLFSASASQFKRPLTSTRGECYGQTQIPGGGGGGGGGGGNVSSQKLTTTDALHYLKEVKDMFQDQKGKYDMFLEVMKDFKAQRTDTSGVIARVKELFKGHNNLIFGFNTFLPKGYEITLDEDEDEAPPKKTVEFNQAINFVNKIKKRFQNDERVYKSFLDILNMYRKENKDINEVYSEVSALFEDHEDLLDEFARFLPDTSATPMTHAVPSARNANQHYNERNSTAPSTRLTQMDRQRRRDRVSSSHAECDLSVDRPEMEDDKAMMKVLKEQRKRGEKENRDRRIRDQDDREPEHDSSRDFSLQPFPDKRKSSQKAEGFGNSNFASYDDRDNIKSIYNQEFVFFEKVKEKLGNEDDYQAFLKCLNIYNQGIIKRNELQNLVTDLLGKYPDLMEEFIDYLERHGHIAGFLAGVASKKSLGNDGHASRSLKVDDKDKEQKHEIDGAKEKERCREKYMAKSIQELDLSNCGRCTPSYRLLPDDYPISSASQRSELGAQVLNDHWVSVTSGSEDYSFKHMRRNQYEESLFRCEDDRFELDMLLESVSSTTKRAEELLNSINENKVETPVHIEDHLTALNLRCIERLYGDHGLDVMDILRKNTILALPVILTRLKQKQEEWTRCRTDFNKVWAEIYVKNHYKSLDHRSFYFKQQDSKNLSTRFKLTLAYSPRECLTGWGVGRVENVSWELLGGMTPSLPDYSLWLYVYMGQLRNFSFVPRNMQETLVAEIKELKEKQQKEDDVLLAFAAGKRQPLVPNLKYDYPDKNIHEDLYKLVQYSCEEVCSTKEQLNKVLRLWTNFVEPMLGIVSHPNGSEISEGEGKPKHPVMNCTSSSMAEIENPNSVPMISTSKQAKSPSNGDENILQELGNLCRLSFESSDKLTKDDSSCELDHVCKDGRAFNVLRQEREQKDKVVTVRVSGLNIQGVADSKTSFMIGSECGHERNSVGEIAGSGSILPVPGGVAVEDCKIKAGIDAGSPSEGGIAVKSVLPANEGFRDGAKNDRCHEGSTGPSKIEKEEGELSPNGDFEEDNFDAYGDSGLQAMAKGKNSVGCMRHGSGNGEELHRQDIVEGNVADDEDSENVSEAGDDASGSDSAGDVCSRKELEEDEDIECDDAKAESEGEAEGMVDTKDVGAAPLPEHFLMSVKPLAKHVPTDSVNEERKDSRILYERILSAKVNSSGAEIKWRTSKEARSSDPYASALYNLLDGSADNAKFEDECRAIIGNQSYVLFTLDKLIYKLVKQLQTVASDEMAGKLLQLYEYETSRKSESFIDSVYYYNTRFFLHEENIYRLEFSSAPCTLSTQLMDNATEKPEVLAVCVDPTFATYLHDDYLSICPGKKESHGITLLRNKQKYADLDEFSALSMAMEGVKMFNGLECKVACNSCKHGTVDEPKSREFFPACRFDKKALKKISSTSGHISRSNSTQVYELEMIESEELDDSSHPVSVAQK